MDTRDNCRSCSLEIALCRDLMLVKHSLAWFQTSLNNAAVSFVECCRMNQCCSERLEDRRSQLAFSSVFDLSADVQMDSLKEKLQQISAFYQFRCCAMEALLIFGVLLRICFASFNIFGVIFLFRPAFDVIRQGFGVGPLRAPSLPVVGFHFSYETTRWPG